MKIIKFLEIKIKREFSNYNVKVSWLDQNSRCKNENYKKTDIFDSDSKHEIYFSYLYHFPNQSDFDL